MMRGKHISAGTAEVNFNGFFAVLSPTAEIFTPVFFSQCVNLGIGPISQIENFNFQPFISKFSCSFFHCGRSGRAVIFLSKWQHFFCMRRRSGGWGGYVSLSASGDKRLRFYHRFTDDPVMPGSTERIFDRHRFRSPAVRVVASVRASLCERFCVSVFL